LVLMSEEIKRHRSVPDSDGDMQECPSDMWG
jgi:hypothetical protein